MTRLVVTPLALPALDILEADVPFSASPVVRADVLDALRSLRIALMFLSAARQEATLLKVPRQAIEDLISRWETGPQQAIAAPADDVPVDGELWPPRVYMQEPSGIVDETCDRDCPYHAMEVHA